MADDNLIAESKTQNPLSETDADLRPDRNNPITDQTIPTPLSLSDRFRFIRKIGEGAQAKFIWPYN